MLCRYSGFFIASPRLLASVAPFWADVDIEEWSDRYQWEEDDFNGFIDISQNPFETYNLERGDCVDYATVVVSWAIAHHRRGLGIGLCGYNTRAIPIPRHVIAYDDDRTYSSGVINEESPDEFVSRSDYDWILTRTV